jgi:hypothetical protein
MRCGEPGELRHYEPSPTGSLSLYTAAAIRSFSC